MMKLLTTYFALFFVIVMSTACTQDGSQFSAPSYEAKMTAGEFDAPDEAELPGRKLIRTAELRMEVIGFHRKAEAARQLVRRAGAEIEEDTEEQYGNRLQRQMVIRVAPEKLDSLLDELAELAEVIESRSVRQEDVTRQYIDLESRLSAKRALVARYESLLSAAVNVGEVMEVERQLQSAIAELESMEGQMRYLERQVSLSSIRLSMYEQTATGLAERSFGREVADAFRSGWDLLQQLFLGAIGAWPLLAIGLAGLIWWRRRKR